MFDGDLLSAIDHVARYVAYTSKVEVVHHNVLVMLFMRSLQGHNSWLHNCNGRSISSIEGLFDGFLKHF